MESPGTRVSIPTGIHVSPPLSDSDVFKSCKDWARNDPARGPRRIISHYASKSALLKISAATTYTTYILTQCPLKTRFYVVVHHSQFGLEKWEKHGYHT